MLIKSIWTNNDCYKVKRTITVKGLMLHSVGCPQPNAEVFVKNWNTDVGVGVHAFIDGLTGNVYQTLPWNHRAWHCGDAANNTHIGVEMCEPDCITYTSGANFTCSDYERAKAIVTRTYNAAVDLFAQLCNTYNLNPLTDIISHREGALKGVASNHGDPEHLWAGLNTGFTMDGFRQAVKAKMQSAGFVDDKVQAKFEPYRVIITASVLNVRSGAGTNYSIATQVKKNEVYTIVDELNGWGKLKSGAGWISLSYTQKL